MSIIVRFARSGDRLSRFFIAAFYLLSAAALGLVMTRVAQQILPAGAAIRLGHNSEAITMCLLVSALVHLVRSRAKDSERPWRLLLALAALGFVMAATLSALRGEVDSVVATLTEAFSAAGFVALYLVAPRSPVLAWVVSGSLLLGIVVFNRTEFVTLQSESLVFAVLLPILMDVVCPRVLNPGGRHRPWATITWCIGLVGLPLLLALVHAQHRPGVLGEAAHYGHRATEAFIAMLVLTLYFIALIRADDQRSTPEVRDADRVNVAVGM